MDLQHMTDGELAHAFAIDRSDDAFSELIRRHRAMVYKTGRRLTGSEHDAEDLTQAVFALLANRASELTDHESLGGWLYNSAWHIASKMRRETQRRRRRERVVAAAQSPEHYAQTNGDDLPANLAEAMTQLSEPMRDVIVLYHFTGMTLQQISATTGEPVGTVAARLSRARAALRELLSARGLTLGAVGLSEGLGLDNHSHLLHPGNSEVGGGRRASSAVAPSSSLMLRCFRQTPDGPPPLPSPAPSIGHAAITSSLWGAIEMGAAALGTLRGAIALALLLSLSVGAIGASVRAAASPLRRTSPNGYGWLDTYSFLQDASALTQFLNQGRQKDQSLDDRPSGGGGGGGSGGVANSSVPEPGTATIIGGAVVVIGLRRPRHGGEPRDRR